MKSKQEQSLRSRNAQLEKELAAKTRELEIEAALERVRARAMTMQNSVELTELIETVFNELTKLNLIVTRCRIWIFDPSSLSGMTWQANSETPTNPLSSFIKYNNHPFYLAALKAWKERSSKWVYELKGDEKRSWDEFLFNETGLSYLPEIVKEGMRAPERVLLSASFNNFGAIQTASLDPLSDEQAEILSRFVKVFDMTYTRFNDLKLAEAQAREAQIELALERVRSRAMAMHKTDELIDAGELLYKELTGLGISSLSVCYVLVNEADKTGVYYGINPVDGKVMNPQVIMPHSETKVMRSLWASWLKQEPVHFIALDRQASLEHQTYIGNIMAETFKAHNTAEWFTVAGFLAVSPERIHIYSLNFRQGYLFLVGGAALAAPDIDILTRFTKVFELTYTRFLDLQKAEAQTREGRIELALERVRARTMAMQKSDELPEAANLLFQQVQELGMPAWSAGYAIWDEDKKACTLYMSSEGVLQPPFRAPLTDEASFIHFYEAWQRGETFHVEEIGGEALVEHYKYMRTLPVVGEILDKIIAAGFPVPTFQIFHSVYFSQGFLLFITYEPVPVAWDIFKRFGKVFDQTYTRFLDLKKAEAQAREGQIELALERVRARTMAMQHSDELAETAYILFQQFRELGENPDQATIGIINEAEGVIEYWVTIHGNQTNRVFKFPIDEPNVTHKIYKAWKAHHKSLVIDLGGKALHDFSKFRESMGGAGYNPGEKRRIINVAFFSKGLINVQSTVERSVESLRLLERFANVFEGTYTRFLDLKKAEAQARESQIQLALERVRARTMAMQHSDELAEAASILFQQVKDLGIKAWSTGFEIWEADSSSLTDWVTGPTGSFLPPYKIPLNAYWLFKQLTAAKQRGEEFHEIKLNAQQNRETYTYLSDLPDVKAMGVFDSGQLTGIEFPELQVNNYVFFPQGSLLFITYEPCPEAHDIFKRFGKVFEQTYTRFTDLQKAEEQAREAQIEAALERVRSRTMAMQKSYELLEAASLLFKQIADLGTTSWSSGFMIGEPEDNSINSWMSKPDGSMGVPFNIPLTEDPFFINIYEARQRGEDFYVLESAGKELEETYRYMSSLPEARKAMGAIENLGFQMPTFQITHCVFFSHGFLMFITYQPCPEMWDIFKRFGKVFEQTYTRFLDLQKAEAQAREAQIEAALERVRSRTMGMQHSDELTAVIQVVYEQLLQLGFEINNAGFLVDFRENDDFNLWMADALSEFPIRMRIPYIDHPQMNCFKQAKAKGLDFLTYSLTLEEKNRWFEYCLPILDVREEVQQFIFGCPGLATSAALLNNVSLYLLNFSGIPYSEADNVTLMRFGKVFEQTYTRFKDLEQAEEQAREAQIEAALERVRSRTMGMRKSEELQDAALLLFQQAEALGVNAFACGFNIWDDDRKFATAWMGSVQGLQQPFKTDSSKDIYLPIYEAAQRGDAFFVREQAGEELKVHYDYLATIPIFRDIFMVNLAKTGFAIPSFQIIHCAFFAQGYLMFISYEQCPEAYDIFKRFGKVFEQTYTRFNDLKQAEEQAREALIESSLERVRSKTMAMHNSQDVGDTIAAMFSEFVKLGIETIRCGILIGDSNDEMEVWTAKSNPDGVATLIIGRLDMTIHPLLQGMNSAWKNKESIFEYRMTGDDLKDYYRAINNANYYPVQFDIDSLPEKQFHTDFFFAEGAVFAFTVEPIAYSVAQIFKRFAGVFGQTYRRYLDLKKAEAQAREAEIELGLERVRARTMAMQKSDELIEASHVLFKELTKLGIETIRTGVGIIDPVNRTVEIWSRSEVNDRTENKILGVVPEGVHRVFDMMINADWENQSYCVEEIIGEEVKDYYKKLAPYLSYPGRKKYNKREIFTAFLFPEGSLNVISEERLNDEECRIMVRFARVFGLIYRRFLDLQRAEEQAREAKIEAALEKVRGKAMAMYNSKDLSATASMVFTELRKLGINPLRCGVGMVSKESDKVQLYSATTSADGDSLALMGWVKLSGHPVLERILESILNLEDYFPVLKGKQLKSYYENLLSGLSLPSVPDWQTG